MVEIQFQFIDSKNSETKTVTLSHSCSWKTLLKTLQESFPQFTADSLFVSLIDSNQITCHDDIKESYIFWGLYDSVYSQDHGSVFLLSSVKILKIRFFLNFDLNSHCTLSLLSSSSWDDILQLVYSKFNNFNPLTVKKMEFMNTSMTTNSTSIATNSTELERDEGLECSDTKSFWSLYWKLSETKKTTISFLIYASRCYPIPCEWKNATGSSTRMHGIALISDDISFNETKNALLVALRLVSTEKIEKIQVVDDDNDPIGDDCDSTEVLLRRYKKHSEIAQGVKVLLTTTSLNPQFSDPTFDPRTAELSESNTDFLG
jgi:hypothetical protein